MLENSNFGFHFDESKCAECGGKCCKGEKGYIFITPQEIQKVADFLSMDFEKFCLLYLKKVGYRYSLIEKLEQSGTGYACIFFDETQGMCQIYEMRPKQCLKFPFWDCYRDDFETLLKECIGVVKK